MLCLAANTDRVQLQLVSTEVEHLADYDVIEALYSPGADIQLSVSLECLSTLKDSSEDEDRNESNRTQVSLRTFISGYAFMLTPPKECRPNMLAVFVCGQTSSIATPCFGKPPVDYQGMSRLLVPLLNVRPKDTVRPHGYFYPHESDTYRAALFFFWPLNIVNGKFAIPSSIATFESSLPGEGHELAETLAKTLGSRPLRVDAEQRVLIDLPRNRSKLFISR